jgi:histidyl-tRNA synthetase
MGVEYTINHRLVRGLDYYTHTAFEYKAQGIGAIDTIGGGGRYNGLVGEIGGPDQPGVGLGIGLERISLILEKQGIAVPQPKPLDVYLIALGEKAEDEVTKQLHILRTNGIIAEKDYQGRKMKAQMKSADRMQARYTGILGDDELERGEIALKSMADGVQRMVPLERLAEELK